LGIADLIAASPEGKLSLKELGSQTKADETFLSMPAILAVIVILTVSQALPLVHFSTMAISLK
jgi:hypothetical protein